VGREATPPRDDPQASPRRARAPLRLAGRPRAPRLPRSRPSRRSAARHHRRVARRTQWPDGGWNCDLRPEVTHSSFHETWGPILGLAAYGADEAVERGAEFFLAHRVVFSHRTGELAKPALLKLRFPAYWHYDLLAGLRTLAATGGLGDPRAVDALDLLESKRLRDGTWRTEGRWWKRPESKGSGVEAVDWGNVANDVLTEQAEGVLGAAGRMERRSIREADHSLLTRQP
jgi:hypothetical protein